MIRVSKRLTQAGGYLELDMPHKALECLDNLGLPGPFEAEIEILRGEAFRRQERFQEAADSFKAAARKMPSPKDREAYFAMSVCYHQAGNVAQAVHMLARARGAKPRKRKS
jgi:tetratricopeptide (TPR) repeat protein